MLDFLIDDKDLLEIGDFLLGKDDRSREEIDYPQLGRIKIQDRLKDGTEDREWIGLVFGEHS
jgi:hypothetical protein